MGNDHGSGVHGSMKRETARAQRLVFGNRFTCVFHDLSPPIW